MLILDISRTTLLVGLVAIGLVLVLYIFGGPAAAQALLRLRPANPRVLTWGGLRSRISVALVPSLPKSMPRDSLVGVTYVLVIFSIIIQGLSIGPLVKRLGLSMDEAPTDKC